MRLTNLSFEEWIEHAFSREVRIQQAAWYFDPNHDWWDPKPVEAVAYLTRLFEDPEWTLCWFSDDQIAQGLTYLIGTSASGDNGWLSAMEVPVEARVRCVEAIGKLFVRLFAPRCTPYLSHLSEAAAGTLNCVCYMWWDEFSMHRIAMRSEPATAKGYSFDDHGAHSGTGFARVPGECIAWAGALAASTCERGRAHHRRICLVKNGARSAASRVYQRGAMWLRIVMHRAEIRSPRDRSQN